MYIEQFYVITEKVLVRLINSFHLLLCYILSDLHSVHNFEKAIHFHSQFRFFNKFMDPQL